MALLGEMHYTLDGPNSWVSLPREGGVAYAAQESWVMNETIRVSCSLCSKECADDATDEHSFRVGL